MAEFTRECRRATAVLASLLALFWSAPAFSQGAGDRCMGKREAIGTVVNGKALPLKQVRNAAEKAANGEMVNAELCVRNGQLVYVVTVLSATGKVVYVSVNAASGQVAGSR